MKFSLSRGAIFVLTTLFVLSFAGLASATFSTYQTLLANQVVQTNLHANCSNGKVLDFSVFYERDSDGVVRQISVVSGLPLGQYCSFFAEGVDITDAVIYAGGHDAVLIPFSGLTVMNINMVGQINQFNGGNTSPIIRNIDVTHTPDGFMLCGQFFDPESYYCNNGNSSTSISPEVLKTFTPPNILDVCSNQPAYVDPNYNPYYGQVLTQAWSVKGMRCDGNTIDLSAPALWYSWTGRTSACATLSLSEAARAYGACQVLVEIAVTDGLDISLHKIVATWSFSQATEFKVVMVNYPWVQGVQIVDAFIAPECDFFDVCEVTQDSVNFTISSSYVVMDEENAPAGRVITWSVQHIPAPGTYFDEGTDYDLCELLFPVDPAGDVPVNTTIVFALDLSQTSTVSSALNVARRGELYCTFTVTACDPFMPTSEFTVQKACVTRLERIVYARAPVVSDTVEVVWSVQNLEFFDNPDLLQGMVRFDNPDLGPTCAPIGDLCSEFMCGRNGVFTPRNLISLPYVDSATDDSATSCNTTDYLIQTQGICDEDHAMAPNYTISCPVCSTGVDLYQFTTIYGPFWMTANQTTLGNVTCAYGWAVYFNISTAVIDQDAVCALFGDDLFDVSIVISTTTNDGATAMNHNFLFFSELTADAFFGSVCPGRKRSARESSDDDARQMARRTSPSKTSYGARYIDTTYRQLALDQMTPVKKTTYDYLQEMNALVNSSPSSHSRRSNSGNNNSQVNSIVFNLNFDHNYGWAGVPLPSMINGTSNSTSNATIADWTELITALYPGLGLSQIEYIVQMASTARSDNSIVVEEGDGLLSGSDMIFSGVTIGVVLLVALIMTFFLYYNRKRKHIYKGEPRLTEMGYAAVASTRNIPAFGISFN